MKLMVIVCLAATVAAAPPDYYKQYDPSRDAQILKHEYDQQPNGNYNYAWEQSDGQKAEQYGQVKNEGQEDESLVVRGSFSWIGPDGVTYKVTYTADDDGYQPEIEQGPGGGVPPAVVASLLG